MRPGTIRRIWIVFLPACLHLVGGGSRGLTEAASCLLLLRIARERIVCTLSIVLCCCSEGVRFRPGLTGLSESRGLSRLRRLAERVRLRLLLALRGLAEWIRGSRLVVTGRGEGARVAGVTVRGGREGIGCGAAIVVGGRSKGIWLLSHLARLAKSRTRVSWL